MARNTPYKQFENGASVEFYDTGCWNRGTYLNAYGTWHIVENRSGNRIAVTDRDIRERTRATRVVKSRR
jgi:hypothetical protein